MKLKIDMARLEAMYPMPAEGDKSDAAARQISTRAAVEAALERLDVLVPGLADLLKSEAEGTCSCYEATLRDKSVLSRCLKVCNESKARAIIVPEGDTK